MSEMNRVWKEKPCYLKAVGQNECDGKMVLKDIVYRPEKLINLPTLGIDEVIPNRLVKIFVCDKCGFTYEDDVHESR